LTIDLNHKTQADLILFAYKISFWNSNKIQETFFTSKINGGEAIGLFHWAKKEVVEEIMLKFSFKKD